MATKDNKKRTKKANQPRKKVDSGTRKLTDKEERFCYEYVLHLNGSKAAINAGFSDKSGSARVTACKLLTKTNIQERISYMKQNLAETSQISALKVIQEHQKIAFSSIANLHQTWIERTDFDKLTEEQKACIKSISTKVIKKPEQVMNDEGEFETVFYDVEYVKIELYDKQKSLDSINQMLGFNAPTKQELTGKDGKDLFSNATDEELQAKISELESKLKQ